MTMINMQRRRVRLYSPAWLQSVGAMIFESIGGIAMVSEQGSGEARSRWLLLQMWWLREWNVTLGENGINHLSPRDHLGCQSGESNRADFK
jgi:hypothetical protein